MWSALFKGDFMKRIQYAWLLIFLFPSLAFPCSIFKSPFKDDARISHNVDWSARFPDVQGSLVLNPAHMKKVGELLGAPVRKAEWVSKLRSISFSIAGAEFPVSGFNEKGLSMAVLELPESQFPPANDPRPAVGMAQFVQYNLDVSETIDDVIASEKILRPYSSALKMHFFACDVNNHCAVFQFIDGKMNVYRGQELPYAISTNSPYPESVLAAKSCIAQSCSAADNSLLRFAKVSLLKTQMDPTRNYDNQAYEILNVVAQSAGSITQFQLTYDAKNLVFSLRKRDAKDVAYVNVDFSKINCQDPRLIIPITENLSGDLKDSWKVLTRELQTEMAVKMGLPPAAAALYGRYPFESISCE